MTAGPATIAISLVGTQPTATAVALRSWVCAYGPLDRVWLLSTPYVGAQAARLRRFLRTLGSAVGECEVIPISSDLDPADGLLPVHQVLERRVHELPPSNRLVFCADPGLRVLVLAAARSLPGETMFLHADTDVLYQRWRNAKGEEVRRDHLQDIGLPALLDLYDLRASFERVSGTVDLGGWHWSPRRRSVRRLTIEVPGNSSSPVLDYAYERHGRLYGLVHVDASSGIRAVRNLQRYVHDLKGLQPVISVVSDNCFTRRRAAEGGMDAFRPVKRDGWRHWMEGKSRLPGAVKVDGTTPLPNESCCQGAGGTGPPLALWMGLDPSATLVGLFTHRPQRAWVMYDAAAPRVCELVGRLQQVCAELPVEEMTFVPSNRFGEGTFTTLQALPGLHGNATPGTKAQVLALARVPGITLWTLRQNREDACALFDPSPSLPLLGPPISLQARIVGGSLCKEGSNVMKWDRSRALKVVT